MVENRPNKSSKIQLHIDMWLELIIVPMNTKNVKAVCKETKGPGAWNSFDVLSDHKFAFVRGYMQKNFTTNFIRDSPPPGRHFLCKT